MQCGVSACGQAAAVPACAQVRFGPQLLARVLCKATHTARAACGHPIRLVIRSCCSCSYSCTATAAADVPQLLLHPALPALTSSLQSTTAICARTTEQQWLSIVAGCALYSPCRHAQWSGSHFNQQNHTSALRPGWPLLSSAIWESDCGRQWLVDAMN